MCPKKGGKLRLVMDCRPINVNMETPKFAQEWIPVMSELIQSEDEMITIDLQNGFHHVGIYEDDQSYFSWGGKYYIWTALPFGVQCAPYFFNKILRPVIKFLREIGIRIAPFVDDFLIMAKAMFMADHSDFTINTFEELGWRLNRDKCQLIPSKERSFVGFLLSTKGEPWLRVMPQKIRKLQGAINGILLKQHVSARQLACILGQCIAMTKAVIPGKLLLCNCYRVLSTKRDWEDTQLVLTDAAIKDLKWWKTAIKGWNRAPLIQKEVEVQVETDASSLGWEVILQTVIEHLLQENGTNA